MSGSLAVPNLTILDFPVKTLSIANQKGGVGKSTLAVHLAYAALEAGLRVLLVDMDKQGSLSLSFPPSATAVPGMVASSLYTLDAADTPMPEVVSDKLSIIRADNGLLSVDKFDNSVIRNPRIALQRFADSFDLCLLDTPPLLGLRIMASLAASDYVVTPVSVGLFELAGVADLMQTINVVRTKGINPRLRHLGILPMKTNTRSTDEKQALADLRRLYGTIILPETLPERAAVKKAVARRKPVWVNSSGEGHLKAAVEWRAACASILRRI